ncbi:MULTISPECIES: acyl-CoA dehydrogenase family protein [unclassified Streptomyces]|uniref:acyl-CoA dehydrogenase family protein n=1 Tax=unclassified Streptomyces TaxID=2593676 RepID=UPI00278C1F65|nr:MULTISPECIES: acyl-CoA dehydrogenase family protein [unclassified Streptomyces]
MITTPLSLPLDPTTLATTAAHHAPATEQAGRLHPDVVQALRPAGFARHFVPRHRGGNAGGFAELVTAVAAVGEGCASSAWCAALLAAHARLAAHLPEQAQAELWADSPDTTIAAAIVPPAGRLVPTPGGWRLTGRWGWASGIEHCDWVLLATLDDTVTGPPAYRVLLVPRRDVRVHHTWDSVGLSGTGSHSVSVDDVFVPAHRSCLRDTLLTGVTDPEAAACHRVPYPLVAALLFCAPALGAARGALAAWTALAGERGATADPSTQRTLARSSADIDMAALLLESAARRADHAALQPPAAFAPEAAARNQRDASRAAELLTDAVERLFRTAGARALTRTSPLQRAWRDIHAVSAHATLQPGPAATAYAASTFAQHQA